MPDLVPWIMAHHRQTTGMSCDRSYADHVTAFKEDPDLLAAAREEHARLVALDNALANKLAQRDHIEYVRMISLGEMLKNHDEA
jgi:hypothetical protein